MKPITRRNKEQVVAYARYSDDGQREESIDAQLRAIREYAKKNNMLIIEEYIDRGKSATNDRRAEFQRMIKDAKNRQFKKVIVHKFDRFSRNMEDSVMYTVELRKYGVEVVSAMEQFDDSPMGGLMRYLMMAMADMYSKNLSNEVEKGKKENAYQGKHGGGKPPLGYDVNHETMKLTINEKESEAVRMIFSMFLEGKGYNTIIEKLNLLGYKTKRGKAFGKNSLYEILKNEKYTGTLVYNRSSRPVYDPIEKETKFNRHKLKPDEEIIRTENAHPAIITKEDFDRVASKMLDRKRKASSYTAKETYLLSGKLYCGECGSKYNGINRPANGRRKQYVSYRCSRRNGSLKCKNSEISREVLESFVLDKLANYLFSDAMAEQLYRGYCAFFLSRRTGAKEELETVRSEIDKLSKDIEVVLDLMIQTHSSAMSDKLNAMESRRDKLQAREIELNCMAKLVIYHKSTYTKAFRTAKKKLMERKLEQTREIIEQFVDRIDIFKEKIVITFNFDGSNEIEHTKKKKPFTIPKRNQSTASSWFDTNSNKIDTISGRGRRTRTLNKGFGDPRVTITPCP